jgi:transposase
MGSTRRRFTEEYKDQAVAFVIEGNRSIADVDRNIGVHEMTLGKWVCEHERRKRGEAQVVVSWTAVLHGRWGLLALQSRLTEGGSKHREGHWLKTVVLNVAGKGAAGSRQVWIGKMSDEREFSAVDVSKPNQLTSNPGSAHYSGMSLGISVYCPGGVRHTGSMSPIQALWRPPAFVDTRWRARGA